MASKSGEVNQNISNSQQQDVFSMKHDNCIDIDYDIDSRGDYIFFKSIKTHRFQTNPKPYTNRNI